VDVPFELLRPFVLPGHDPATGFPELLDESYVPQDQPRLTGHVADQLLLRRVHRVACRKLHAQGAQHLVSVANLDGIAPQIGQILRPERDRRRLRRDAWPDRRHVKLTTDAQPDPSDP
jgi:hypothetical protein